MSAADVGRTRFGILALIATGTLINYLDRTILGIATPSLSKDLDVSPALMGLIFSAFRIEIAQ